MFERISFPRCGKTIGRMQAKKYSKYWGLLHFHPPQPWNIIPTSSLMCDVDLVAENKKMNDKHF